MFVLSRERLLLDDTAIILECDRSFHQSSSHFFINRRWVSYSLHNLIHQLFCSDDMTRCFNNLIQFHEFFSESPSIALQWKNQQCDMRKLCFWWDDYDWIISKINSNEHLKLCIITLLFYYHAVMDRRIDSKSVTPGGGSDDQLSPPMASSRGAASPAIHRHSRSGSIVKRSQNTKEAAQRLAQMMSHQQTDDSEDDEDLLSDFSPPAATSSSSAPATGRSQIRHRSPMVCIPAINDLHVIKML